MSKTAEFFAAVASGDTDRARELLTADRGLAAARNGTDATALHYVGGKPLADHARECGHEEIARLFAGAKR
jgi:hypothetical protein